MKLKLIAVAAALWLASIPAHAAVIDFEDLGVAPGTQFDPPDFATVTSGGFDFVHGPRNAFSDLHFPNGSSFSIGGTTELVTHQDFIMTRNGGGAFTLNQFDWGGTFGENATFEVIGQLMGGGTVSQLFSPDGNSATLQTFVLGGSFNNLVSVTWEHFGRWNEQNVDNLVVDAAAVPEPTTLALLGLGLAGLRLTKRRGM